MLTDFNLFSFFVALFLAVVALLLCVYSPTNFLWKIAVVVGGYGHWVALGIVFYLFINIRTEYWLTTSVFILATIIYMYPLCYSIWMAKRLKNNLSIAFRHRNPDYKDCKIDFLKLFNIAQAPKVQIHNYCYSENATHKLNLDIYINGEDNRKKPCVVVIHGGSWSSGSNKDLPALNHHLASKGYIVVAVNYALSPLSHYPAESKDIIKAIEYLNTNAEKFNIDTNNIFLLGRSAGGQLAQMVGFNLGKNIIKGIIAYYSPADLVWGYDNPASIWVHDSRRVLEDFIGSKINENSKAYEAASPVYQNLHNAPPVLMLHGKLDVLVAFGHNLRLIPKLDANQIPYYLLSIPWATHGFDYFFNSPAAQLSTYAIEYFITNYETDS